jgi:hypothetical protein
MQLIRALILVEIVALVLLSREAKAQTTKEINTIADIYAAIRACWKARSDRTDSSDKFYS